jgi:hypothetical protein
VSADIYNLTSGTHLIQAWFFNSSNSAVNKILEQTFKAGGSPTFVNDANGYATGIALTNVPATVAPFSSQVIVELIPDGKNPIRLRPPSVTYYTVTTTDITLASYPIVSSTSSFVVDTVQASNIQVYLNGITLGYASDGTQDYTISNNSIILTSRPSLSGNPPIVGSQLAIETFYYNNITNSQPDSLMTYDYDFMITNEGENFLLSPNYSYLTNATIKITTFAVQDSLGIVSQRFVGNPYRTYTLNLPVLNSNYLWVQVNTSSTGLTALINGIDYQLLEDQLTVLIGDDIDLSIEDTVFIMSFADPGKSAKTLGYRITKDFLGKSSFTRISSADSTYLTRPLSAGDTEIYIADGSILSPANSDKNVPGVILISGERIEFFNNTDNVLSQLRRATGGTSPAEYLEIGTVVMDQGINQTVHETYRVPYSDIVLVQNTFTSVNLENTYFISTTTITTRVNPSTSSSIKCDGITLMTTKSSLPYDPYTGKSKYDKKIYSISTASIDAKNQIEVYYGGKMLKKDMSFHHDTSIKYDGIETTQIKGTVPSAESLSSATIYLGDAYICEDTGEVWVCTINQFNLSTVPKFVYSGLIRTLPDFTLNTSTQQLILNTATVNINTGTQLTVVKRQVGTSWNDVISINSSTSLLDSTGTIVKFLSAGPAVLPTHYFYGSNSTAAKPGGGL